ncbi:MAG: hypothetical protein ACEQSC_00290 [Candidatus Nanopelagicaceae bacterium]
MSDDRQKEQKLKAAGDLFNGFASSIGVFVKAARAEYKKDRSGFMVHRQGQLKQQLNKGLATGLKVSREIQAQVQNIPQAAIDIANNISQSIQPQSSGQTANEAFKQGLQMIDADEKKQEQGLENSLGDSDQKQAEPEIERPKVQDELLYADGKFMDGITKEDMLAIAELITAQKGDKLQGDAAKGLTIEYNGEILLKTDRDGRVDTNRLNDQDLMSKFDSRATAEIAEFKAQAEELKRELKASISQDVIDRKALEIRVDDKSTEADKDFSNIEKQTHVALEHNSPQGTQALQDIGSKRSPVVQQGDQQQNKLPDLSIEKALQFLGVRDDGAKAKDGKGFNLTDSRETQGMIKQINNGVPLTSEQAKAALDLLPKYLRTQLNPNGFTLPKWEDVAHQYQPEVKQQQASQSATPPQSNTPPDKLAPINPPIQGQGQDDWAKLEPLTPQIKADPPDKLDRMAKVASTAFIQNYKGTKNNGTIQGRVQAPDGAIIERTQRDGKGFDLSVEKDGVRHEVASYSYADSKFTIKEGMIAAVPAIQEISSNIDVDGKFTPITVVPKLEQPDQTQEVQQEPVTVGGDDGR